MRAVRGAVIRSLGAALTVMSVVLAQDATVLEPGVTLRLWDVGGDLEVIPTLIDGQTPNVDVRRDVIDFEAGRGDFAPLVDSFLAQVTSTLTVGQTGTYRFRLTSDDGSILAIDGATVVDNDGVHAPEAREGAVRLTAGAHALEIWFFQKGGGAELRLEWREPETDDWRPIPAAALTTPSGVVRVTAPGKKKVGERQDDGPAGDGRPLRDVHPAYRLFTCRPEGFEPKVGGLDFLPDGRLALCTFDAEGAVWFVQGVHGDDRSKIVARRFAAGLAEPLGLKVVAGRVFVLQKQELTELSDTDGDGVADVYRCVTNAWDVSSNRYEFALGLEFAGGHFYFNLAAALGPDGVTSKTQVKNRGRTARVSLEGGAIEWVTEGLRTPNGIGSGLDGELFLTDNQGDWLPAGKLLRLVPGAFYGARGALPEGWQEKPVTPPVVWLPHNEIGNSPGECGVFPAGPFVGQLAVSDVTHGGLKRVFVEQVGEVWQGCVFRFTQGLEAGVARFKFMPDGTIFIGGIGNPGNWGQPGKSWFGLQRLRPGTGETAFEMLAVRLRSNGLEVEMTEPLLVGHGGRLDDWRLTQWRYEPSAAYGGPKVDERPIVALSVTVSADRRRVFLETGDVRPGHVVHVRLARRLRSLSRQAPWATEGWYTVNAVPTDRPGQVGMPDPLETANVLDESEKASGWASLFDGVSTAQWRGYRASGFPNVGWVVEDGTLHHVAGQGGGDIVTVETFADFEFACEWRVAPGGNSGIMYRVDESGSATYSTGPEMQVLDDRLHRDGKNPLTSAGALYGLIACSRPVVLPAGEWNHARIVVHGDHVEHWLNGVRVVDYILGNDAWKRLVAGSKFAGMAGFGKSPRGHIALQDHGDAVWYRDLRVKKIR